MYYILINKNNNNIKSILDEESLKRVEIEYEADMKYVYIIPITREEMNLLFPGQINYIELDKFGQTDIWNI
jgi:hypothetical protein